MYSSRYVLQRRLSQSSVMCPPYMISPNRYLRSSHGTFIITIIMKNNHHNLPHHVVALCALLTTRPIHTLTCTSLPVTQLCTLASTHNTSNTSYLCISLQVVVEDVY